MTPASVTCAGHGLISGKAITATLTLAPNHSGVVFQVGDVLLPATLACVSGSQRGVTLSHAGVNLSIIEHLLAAVVMARLETGLHVQITCDDPNSNNLTRAELPILDGSAQPWLDMLRQLQPQPKTLAPIVLKAPVFLRKTDSACIYALPASTFGLRYTLDYSQSHPGHPDVSQQFSTWHWHADPHCQHLAPARTFGFVEELPAMQASGLALGVSLENTLGLTQTGEYLQPLRFAEEPLRHKMLDLLGDLSLAFLPYGLNPLALQAEIIALNAGHTTHLSFAQCLHDILFAH